MRIVDEGIGNKYADQTNVFKDQGRPFTYPAYHSTDACRKKHVQCGIHQKQNRNRSNAVTEFFNHQESGKDDEDLAARSGKKRQRIVEPVAFAQDQFPTLSHPDRKLWKAQPRPDRNSDCDAASQDIDRDEIQ